MPGPRTRLHNSGALPNARPDPHLWPVACCCWPAGLRPAAGLLAARCWRTAAGPLLATCCWPACGQLHLVGCCWPASGQLLLATCCWPAVAGSLLATCCWPTARPLLLAACCWPAVGQLLLAACCLPRRFAEACSKAWPFRRTQNHPVIAAELCRSMLQGMAILPYCLHNHITISRSLAERTQVFAFCLMPPEPYHDRVRAAEAEGRAFCLMQPPSL